MKSQCELIGDSCAIYHHLTIYHHLIVLSERVTVSLIAIHVFIQMRFNDTMLLV